MQLNELSAFKCPASGHTEDRLNSTAATGQKTYRPCRSNGRNSGILHIPVIFFIPDTVFPVGKISPFFCQNFTGLMGMLFDESHQFFGKRMKLFLGAEVI